MQMVAKETDDKELIQNLRRVVQSEVAPLAREVDEKAEFPLATYKRFCDMGLMTMAIPEEYGGLGLGVTTECRVVQEVARACGSSAEMILTQSTELHALREMGTEAQKKDFFRRVVEEQMFLAFALSEPDTGSDPKSIRATAEPSGNEYVLNGTKAWVSHGGGVAEEYLIMARVPETRRGITAFWVPKGAEGFTFGDRYDTMGLRGTWITDLHLKDVVVPVERRLGEVGDGLRLSLDALTYVRPIGAAIAVGIAEGALMTAAKYALQRTQFDRPIATFQAVRMMLADMQIAVETAKSLVYHAAAFADEGAPETNRVVPMAKIAATDAAMKVTLDAIQVMGAFGYTREAGVERAARDAKATQIWEGTNQIQRLIVARELLGPEVGK